MIYLLIGQKGSGKSFIGELMEAHFGLKFIRVEDWAKSIKKGRALDDDTYLKEVFDTIEKGIRSAMKEHENLVFESTGLTEHFDQMLTNLQTDFMVVTIGVIADPKTCLERVRSRDQSIHIEVNGQQLKELNKAIRDKNVPTAFRIDNRGKSPEELREQLTHILAETRR
nr:AAA family ATPase [Allomuricauda sp.]